MVRSISAPRAGSELVSHGFHRSRAFGRARAGRLLRRPSARVLTGPAARTRGSIGRRRLRLNQPCRRRGPDFRGRRGQPNRGGDAPGQLIVMSVTGGSTLAVLAAADCDMGLVAYEMALLADRTWRALTPEPR